jgi:hypothetical protein
MLLKELLADLRVSEMGVPARSKRSIDGSADARNILNKINLTPAVAGCPCGTTRTGARIHTIAPLGNSEHDCRQGNRAVVAAPGRFLHLASARSGTVRPRRNPFTISTKKSTPTSLATMIPTSRKVGITIPNDSRTAPTCSSTAINSNSHATGISSHLCGRTSTML